MKNMRFRSYWDTVLNPTSTSMVTTRSCNISNCTNQGEYKAPKLRDGSREYYWFCLEHVKEYNKNWDFFDGMSSQEIEEQMKKNMVGDRPTWRSNKAGINAERLKRKIHENFTSGESVFKDFNFGTDSEDNTEEKKKTFSMGASTMPHPAVEALKVMGLAPPIIWDEVKAHYKTLVKKYHPDTNQHDEFAEEKLKAINLAYSILKISYKDYTELDK